MPPWERKAEKQSELPTAWCVSRWELRMSTTSFPIWTMPWEQSKKLCDFLMAREWDADAYHRISGPQFSWGKRVLERLALRGDEILMDAGCGTGKLTAELLEQLPHGHVIAVDLSYNMLAGAREHLQPRFGRQVSLVAADLLHLPFVRAFDGIFSTAAFHWVPDHDRLFRALHQ